MELRFEAYIYFNHPNFANPYLPSFYSRTRPNKSRTGVLLGHPAITVAIGLRQVVVGLND